MRRAAFLEPRLLPLTVDILFDLFTPENVLAVCVGLWVLDILWPDDKRSKHDEFIPPFRKD